MKAFLANLLLFILNNISVSLHFLFPPDLSPNCAYFLSFALLILSPLLTSKYTISFSFPESRSYFIYLFFFNFECNTEQLEKISPKQIPFTFLINIPLSIFIYDYSVFFPTLQPLDPFFSSLRTPQYSSLRTTRYFH